MIPSITAALIPELGEIWATLATAHNAREERLRRGYGLSPNHVNRNMEGTGLRSDLTGATGRHLGPSPRRPTNCYRIDRENF